MKTKDCKKCGNPKKMYWCAECESSSENEMCDNCGERAILDNDYHNDCDWGEVETKALQKREDVLWKAIKKLTPRVVWDMVSELIEINIELEKENAQT